MKGGLAGLVDAYVWVSGIHAGLSVCIPNCDEPLQGNNVFELNLHNNKKREKK